MKDGLKDAHRDAIIAEIAANDRVQRAVLFGSRATGTNTLSSDVDIALFGSRLTLTDQARLAAALDKIPMAQSVDLVLYGAIRDRTLREHVLRQGIEWFARPIRDEGCETSPEADTQWLNCTVAEACRGIDYGLTAAASSTPTGVKFLRITDIVSGQIDWRTVPYVTVDSDGAEKYRLRHGDIVLARTGASTGFSAYVKHPPHAVFASYLVRLRTTSRFDGRFLAYYLMSERFRQYIHGVLGDKSAQPNASASTMTAAPLHAPRDKEEQRAIGHILGTLDDKIELNRRVSETLEAMARALFKSWFVDFDPVQAKMDGRDTGLPRSIADLFPGRLVDSEIGEIPEGWTVAPLEELIDVNPRRPLQRGQVVPYLPMAKMPTQGHLPTSVDLRPFGSGMRFANGDTLVARITPCLENGKTAYVDFLHEDEVGWGSTEYIVLKPKPPLPDQFAYCLARSAGFREFAIQNMSGTSGRQRVPATAVKGHLMVVPPERLASEFGDCAKSLFERASRAGRESDTLVALRDTLLPKLVSGAIRVPKAETALESAT